VDVERSSGVDFGISAEGGNFVFLAIPAGAAALVCAAHFVKYAIKPTVWVATQTRVAISQMVRK